MPDVAIPPSTARRLADRLLAVRRRSLELTAGLSAEDMVVQSMPDASPVKWHLAHTTWFFETFILVPHAGLAPFDADFGYLFNSYYDAVGDRHPRPKRGLLTRPPLNRVLDWRAHVDGALGILLDAGPAPEVVELLELGLNHEQQHQELILTDLKHLLSQNRLEPNLRPRAAGPSRPVPPLGWVPHPGGLVEIGHDGPGFAFDNEGPRHRVWLDAFHLADRPVTCGEWLEFMADGGYRTPSLWLSDGWAAVQANGWSAPDYWDREMDGGWSQFTLSGRLPVDHAEPVTHVSFFEADAFARWAGARLPTEAEWEVVCRDRPATGGFADSGRFHPAPLAGPSWHGDVWEWTASAYLPYPGFATAPGAVGEYNGKFMSGQMVLRGGSCATPAGHARATYRNFFTPQARWQFSGLRLARGA